jgi:hypothetical protein
MIFDEFFLRIHFAGNALRWQYCDTFSLAAQNQ